MNPEVLSSPIDRVNGPLTPNEILTRKRSMKEFDKTSSDKPGSPDTRQRHSKPNRVLGVALDMDGLLFDTERLYWDVGDTVLRRRGHRYSAALQQRMMGRVGVAAMQQMIDYHLLSDAAEDLLAESELLYGQRLAQ